MNNSRIFFQILLLLLSQFACLGIFAQEFAPVHEGRKFSFPKDHGAHPEFKTEWWYFTGHLDSPEGKAFGFQWTMFRSALVPPGTAPVQNPSRWRASEIYLGHLAISDLKGEKFRYGQSMARGALGLAGSSTERFQVWLPGFRGESAGEVFNLTARSAELEIQVQMQIPAEVVPHGRDGYSAKSPESGHASYYYSIPNIPAKGELRIAGNSFQVQGAAWMDHEFGSNQLAASQIGWDWMGLPLGNAASLMIYRLRERDAARQDFLAGTYADAAGRIHLLNSAQIELRPEAYWQSPRSGARYPIAWSLRIPAQGVDLRVTAAFADQELDTSATTRVIYWEGSVRVKGKADEREVDSKGYLEMTGYAAPFRQKL